MNSRVSLVTHTFLVFGLVLPFGACAGTDPSDGGVVAGAASAGAPVSCSAACGGQPGAGGAGGSSSGAGGSLAETGGGGTTLGGGGAVAGGGSGAGAAGLAGATAGSSNAGSPHATYSAVAAQILHPTCAGAGCHGGEMPPQLVIQRPDTTFDDAAVYTTLTTFKASKCGNRVLVKPNAPAESALYLALIGGCEVATVMPFGCTPDASDPFNGNCVPNASEPSEPVSYTNPTSIEDLRQWIEKGAPQY